MKKVRALVLGAGSRGNAYAAYSRECPDELEVVAVAEPDQKRRDQFAERYQIGPEKCFTGWEEALAQPKMADAVFVCTLDEMHTAPALKALELGYDVLLEKPMSNTEEECIAIERGVRESGRVLTVCHVLRYTPFFRKIKELIREGAIGKTVTIDLIENVGYWHQAHSFVRGNWRDAKETSPMILAKSCHDLDIICWLMEDHCEWISSFGSLVHFTKENQPAGAADRCLDGCPYEEECVYFAPKIYLTGSTEWPVDIITTDLTPEGITEALRKGPYGRCVYCCDNNVVDHQVVNMEFAGGATASFTMTGFTAELTRQIKIMGTNGQITGDLDRSRILLQRFGEEDTTEVPVPGVRDGFGHGGGDFGVVQNFIRLVNGEGDNLTSANVSLQSHRMCFAAEKSRREHCAVRLGK